MTDQPQPPGGPGNSGAWQPVPGGGDYDPDQTMHVSFAAQLPPEPQPGEDPLSAHGPAGAGPADGDAATQWTIPVIRDEAEGDSGEYSVGAFGSPWDRAPSPAPTQSFSAGMFSQGAAAAQAARAEDTHSGADPHGLADPHSGADPQGHADTGQFGHPSPADHLDHLAGQWAMPFTGPEGGDAAPWLPAHAPAADAAWAAVVDDPESPAAGHPVAEERPDAVHDLYALRDRTGLDEVPGTDEPAAAPGPEGEFAESGEFGESAGFGESADFAAAPDAFGETGEFRETGDFAGIPRARQEDAPDAPAVSVLDEYAVPGEETDETEAEPAPEPEPVEETRSEHPLASYTLRVNGTDRPVTDAWLGESLLYVLRERLGLAGAKDGCEQGECGACSVQVDGRLVASCLVPAATAAGSDVRTVEGLTVEGRPSDVQRALADCGAVQCGFCIPGMAMTVHDLLEGNHAPTDLDVRQALSGNLCRCSGYRGVLDAVRQVVAAREPEDAPAAEDPARIPHQGGPNPSGAAV